MILFKSFKLFVLSPYRTYTTGTGLEGHRPQLQRPGFYFPSAKYYPETKGGFMVSDWQDEQPARKVLFLLMLSWH